MHYEGNIIRPPSEANSILLQVTVGCSRNKCTFCGTYRGERFKIKPDGVIMDDIAFAARYCRRQRRIFLCDGDVLVIPQKRLMTILEAIRTQLPWVTRVGSYANAKSLDMKTPAQLAELRANGLGILYMGVESGDDVTLKNIRKGASADQLIAMGQKAKAAGFKLSVTVLLGIAGRERSRLHAEATGRLLSAMQPDYVGALSLMLVPGTPLDDDHRAGRFKMLDTMELLTELREMFAHTHLDKGLFHANHASNYLPIRARLPRDREAVLRLIDQALEGGVALRPEWQRAL
jgi:radical SAM superfamily enzyme YgiQ (UPF0313 family)